MTPSAADPPLGEDSYAQRLATGLCKLGLVLRHEAWRSRGRNGLTPTQGQILALLRAARNDGLRLSEIADGIGVSPATASGSVAALAAKGLLLKESSADDRRSLRLRLTPAGESEAARAARWPDVLLEAVDTLDPVEQAVLLRSLVKMIRTLQEQGRIAVGRMCVGCRFFRPDAHDDPERPHQCTLTGLAFGGRDLQLDCDEQEPLSPEEAEQVWRAFVAREAAGAPAAHGSAAS